MGSQHNFVGSNDNNLYQRGMNTNLRGLGTQFGTDFGINDKNNKIIDNTDNTFRKYDVIPRNELQYKYINKPYKLTVSFTANGSLTLNEPIKDVVSVKLLNGILEETPTDATTNASLYINLSITELNNVYSTSTGGSLLNSFATLEYDKTIDINRTSNTNVGTSIVNDKVNIYKNKFGANGDIKYYDPPLNSLTQLNVALYGETSTNSPGGSYKCKLEFMIETKEKLRIY